MDDDDDDDDSIKKMLHGIRYTDIIMINNFSINNDNPTLIKCDHLVKSELMISERERQKVLIILEKIVIPMISSKLLTYNPST